MKQLHRIDANHAIYQYSDGFRFGTDAVLLSGFVRCQSHQIGVEFGTGSGISSILLALHKPFRKIFALEIQPAYTALATENVALCGFSDRICVVEGDLKCAKSLGLPAVDFVFSNPPYLKKNSGKLSDSPTRALCRHEELCTIDDVCRSAADLLKDRGSLYLVYRPARLSDLFWSMRQNGIEAKSLIPVAVRQGAKPSLVLVRGVKGASAGLVMEAPFLLEDQNGAPSKDAKRLYDTGVLGGKGDK